MWVPAGRIFSPVCPWPGPSLSPDTCLSALTQKFELGLLALGSSPRPSCQITSSTSFPALSSHPAPYLGSSSCPLARLSEPSPPRIILAPRITLT